MPFPYPGTYTLAVTGLGSRFNGTLTLTVDANGNLNGGSVRLNSTGRTRNIPANLCSWNNNVLSFNFAAPHTLPSPFAGGTFSAGPPRQFSGVISIGPGAEEDSWTAKGDSGEGRPPKKTGPTRKKTKPAGKSKPVKKAAPAKKASAAKKTKPAKKAVKKTKPAKKAKPAKGAKSAKKR